MFLSTPHSFCSDYKSAVEDYTKVIELKPDFAEAYEKRAEALMESIPHYKFDSRKAADDKFNEIMRRVIDDLAKAISLKPEMYLTKKNYFNLGAAKYKLGQYEDALNTLNKAVEAPNTEEEFYALEYDFYQIRGEVKFALKDYQGAVGDYTEALNGSLPLSDYTRKEILKLRAKAYWKLHRYADWAKDTIKSF